MKTLLIITLLFIVSLAACNQGSNKKDQGSSDSTLNSGNIQKTWAEISIKEGGAWKDRVYEGGTFRNVQFLKLPSQHTDHSFYIRYEGPGWDSEKIGYRLYLDWRNAIDIYGKVNDSLVLAGVGQDGFESYHNMSAWGQDILKVGKALGIGSIGRWVKNEVLHFNEVDSTLVSIENSDNQSSIRINYYGWKTVGEKVDLISQLAIEPGKRYTKHTIQSSKEFNGICTGIVNHKMELIKKESENKKWAYLATFGEQTLVPDKLGMAIFYKIADTESVFDWEFDHLIMFKPTTQQITFYFLGAWEKEENGIKTKEAFISYLDGLLEELNNNNKI
jgi:hypothetical protein